MTQHRLTTVTLALIAFVGVSACAPAPEAGGAPDAGVASNALAPQQERLPAGAAETDARLSSSPRHAEWVTVRTGAADSVRAWVVYPERRTNAPVVLVVHEIFGLSNWIRAVADQFAADGFIAIAPDLLTMKNLPKAADGATNPDSARVVIRTLDQADIHRQLSAVANYGMNLPAAARKYGIVGFCWGGGVSFAHAAAAPNLGAAVVYYGSSPETAQLSSVRAPVLGLYGENDARVNATIAPAQTALAALGRTFQPHIFPGAGHGFLRQQDGQGGANLMATQQAWPLTIGFFRKHLGS
jgi:carboxymethylenebutenolidase